VSFLTIFATAATSSSSPAPMSTAKPGAWPLENRCTPAGRGYAVSVRRDARGRQRRLRPVPGAAVTLPSRTPRPAAAVSSSSARERTHLSRPSCDGFTRPLRAPALAAHGDKQGCQASSSGAAPSDELPLKLSFNLYSVFPVCMSREHART
jgi:hypothetical protein